MRRLDSITDSLQSHVFDSGCEVNQLGNLLMICNKGGRPYQEDRAMLMCDDNGVPRRLAVIDGMGGQSAGDVAANVSAQELGRLDVSGQPVDYLFSANAAQRLLVQGFGQLPYDKKPGAGVAIADFDPRKNSVLITNEADVRAYVLRGGRLVAFTGDNGKVPASGQSLAQLENDLDQNKTNLVTGGITAHGDPLKLEDHAQTVNLEDGDLVVLVSDGVHEAVNSRILQILLSQELLRKDPRPWNDRLEERLSSLTHRVGDNWTLLVYCHNQTLVDWAKRRSMEENYPFFVALKDFSEKVLESLSGGAKVGCATLASFGLATCVGGSVVVGGYEAYQAMSSNENPYSDVCVNAVPGKWTVASNGKPVDMSTYAGKEVNLAVGRSGQKARVELRDVPGECLVDQAPRSVAAEHPTANDKVLVNLDGTTQLLHFEPLQGSSNAIQGRDSQAHELRIITDGQEWLRCSTPVSVGCEADADSLRKATK